STPRPPPRSTLFPYTTLFRSQKNTKPVRQVREPFQEFGARDDGRSRYGRLLFRTRALLVCDLFAALQKGRFDHVDVRRELVGQRSEEHTSELQSRGHLVCRLL